MDVATIRQQLPEYARDLKLNLGSVLGEAGAPGLSATQRFGVALASAAATGDRALVDALEQEAGDALPDEQRRGARAAAAVMGMNNVYYRFLHLVEDDEYQTLPAGLRMQVIGKPGIDKRDFELYSLAVSAINGCGMCITSHEKVLRNEQVSRQAIQSAVRIASVISAVAGVRRFADETTADGNQAAA